NHFRVRSVARSGACYAVACAKLICLVADFDNSTGHAVAEVLRLRQAPLHFFISRAESLAFDGIQDLPHKIRSASGLSYQRALRGLDYRSLGPGANQRESGAHQDSSRPKSGWRQLLNLQLAGAKVLYDLFH